MLLAQELLASFDLTLAWFSSQDIINLVNISAVSSAAWLSILEILIQLIVCLLRNYQRAEYFSEHIIILATWIAKASLNYRVYKLPALPPYSFKERAPLNRIGLFPLFLLADS